MAQRHIRAYTAIPGVQVVGVVGKTDENRRLFVDKYHVTRFCHHHSELLSRADIDAVSVVTPTYTHAEIVKDCLRAGCHVLCEKPISLHLQEAYEMVQAAEQANRILMIGFIMRFYREFQSIKRLIEQGRVGDVRFAWFRKNGRLPTQAWYLDPQKSGGVTFEMAIHLIDWMSWIVGSRVNAVSAQMVEDIYNLGKEDSAWILLKFKNHAVGAVGSSYAHSIPPTDIGVVGTARSLTVRRRRVMQEDLRTPRSSLGRLRQALWPPWRPTDNPLRAQLTHFIGCVRHNTPCSVTGRDGLYSLLVAFAALKSAQSLTTIHLDRFIKEAFSPHGIDGQYFEAKR